MVTRDWVLWLAMANGIGKGWPRLNELISLS
jgi:hypothetical protein